ncbi:MAG: hypothetical protein WBA45_07615 [Microthrixaceae bacterium]
MDEPEDPGRARDERKDLPPGAGTKGDDDDISGNAGRTKPFEDGEAGGKLAPGGDNPPPEAPSD